MTNQEAHEQQATRIQQYYAFQSRIYDLTRWSFLFGRSAIFNELPFEHEEPFHLLEVGCGTGHNLVRARHLFSEAKLTGMDVSGDMLTRAKRRFSSSEEVVFLEQAYGNNCYTWTGKLDVILFSYALTMINPQWETLIHQAYKDLRPGGYIAVVDFHDSRWSFFKKHMAGHHVRMDSHILPVLKDNFYPVREEVKSAYLGLWKYLLFVGRKV